MARVFGNGNNWLMAGLVTAILLPALVFIINLPFIIAAGISAIAFAGLAFALSPRSLFEGVTLRAGTAGQIAFARDLLNEALPAAERLEAAGHAIRNKPVAELVTRLANTAHLVFAKV